MAGLELRILSGLHRGAFLPLAAEPLSVGSDEACDVVLVDEGVAPLHATVRALDCGYSIQRQGGAVCGRDGHPLADMLVPGACIALGPVWFSVDWEGQPWPTVPAAMPSLQGKAAKRGRKPWLVVGGGIASAVVLLGLVGFASAPSASASAPPRHSLLDPTRDAHELAKAAAGLTDDKRPASPTDVALREQFRHRLEDAELMRHLDAQLGDTEWSLRGDLDAEEMGRLERVLAGFITEHHVGFPVHAKVIPAEQLLPFHIRQFQGGLNASVAVDDGTRLYVGDSFRGYRLQSVHDNELVFSGPRQIVVRW